MPRILLSWRILFACLPLFLAASPSRAAQPGEQFKTLAPDGAWSWFTDPRAIYRQGKIYAGWVTADGSVQVGVFDPKTGEARTAELAEKFQQDDHAHPALLFLPDGRLAAFYSQHGKGDVHLRIAARPDDIGEWAPERSLGFAAADARGTMHVNPVMLGGAGNAIGLLWRGADSMPWLSVSTDLGQTWSAPLALLRRGENQPDAQTHLKVWSDGKDRVDLAFGCGAPNGVYFLRYEKGAFFKADGSRIGGMESLPLEPAQCDRIYDGATAGAAWVWDVAEGADGQPVVAYARLPTGADQRYQFARWDGKQWQDQELAQAAGAFPRKPTGERGGATHYSGGVALDHADPLTCYVSRPVNGVFEIERLTSADSGKTWRSESLTAGSKQDNVRPVVIRDHPADGPALLWLSLETYTGATRYRAAVKLGQPTGGQPAPATAATEPLPPLSTETTPAAVLAAMERVADWQLAHPPTYPAVHWRAGAGWTGFMALSHLSPNPKYHDAMMQMGEANAWKLGPNLYSADDQVVGQTYLELYLQHHDPRMLEPVRRQFDAILVDPRDDIENITHFKREGFGGAWSWCDALFMAPPVWVRLWAATGEGKYLDFLIKHWQDTSNCLYDKEEHLFYRDSTYFDKREANGKKVFWSRGNGWVMAGLARVMQYLPKTHPQRAAFEGQFREMAEKILTLQQEDGLWRASLFDPQSYPRKEVSGSGFYCFAFAWGVNEGLLDRARFAPAAMKAWQAMANCIAPDGKLTHIQPVGSNPKTFNEDSTDLFGVGAFLLAGSEVHRLAGTLNP